MKAKKQSVHFSSKTDLWATPQDFFNNLNAEFGFQTDVCCLPNNAKCKNFFTPEMDGLKQNWSGVCWMNPPYGRTIILWMRKAYESALVGATVVCLVPSRTDTAWWHDYAMKGDIRFIRGRLKFGDAKNSAPFPSAIIIFRPFLGGYLLITFWISYAQNRGRNCGLLERLQKQHYFPLPEQHERVGAAINPA